MADASLAEQQQLVLCLLPRPLKQYWSQRRASLTLRLRVGVKTHPVCSGFIHMKSLQFILCVHQAACKVNHNSSGTVCACVCAQNACYQLPGTCLANQLDDLTVADLARAAAGTTPLYLVGRYGGGVSGSTQVKLVLPARVLLTAV